MAAASRVIARISYNIAYYSRKEHSNLCYLRVRAHIDVLVRTVAKHHSSGNSTGVHHGIRNLRLSGIERAYTLQLRLGADLGIDRCINHGSPLRLLDFAISNRSRALLHGFALRIVKRRRARG